MICFQGRRRTGSTGATTKTGSLVIKRSDAAPVSLQGWLYKQGSEGLMLWQKRWFVLSEFCLFYYKSPDEERVSGSILLPSYKVSPASKEDGIHRKFAFKAEHKNMRTYYFSAETKDTMIQWMNALSLASILQQEQDFSKRRTQNPPPNNSQLVRSPNQVHNHPPVVHQMFSPNGSAYQYHPPQQQTGMSPNGGGPQPLYANAPPKPRRMNTSRDQSPSPERQMEEGLISPDPILVTGRYHQPLSEVHQAHIIGDEIPPTYRIRPPTERRTPEAYGRMSRMQRVPINRMDYEEVYNQNHVVVSPEGDQRRFVGPQHHPVMNNMSQQQQQYAMHQAAVTLAHMRPNNIDHRQVVPRPHSADFLELDMNQSPQHHQQGHFPNNVSHTPTPGRNYHRNQRQQQPPRPKSSIEQRMLMDRHHFEENQYRSQSRASGIYDPQMDPRTMYSPQQQQQQQPQPMPQQQQLQMPPPQQQQHQLPYPVPSPHDSQLDLASEEVSRYFPTPSPRKSLPQPQQQQQQQQQTAYQNLPSSRRQSANNFPGLRAESVTPMVAAASGMLDNAGEFKRSSSARLHRNKRNHPEIFGHAPGSGGKDEYKKKEQREESMKRLLEWKQRMLQSPLTRKSSRNASRTQTPTNSDSPIPSFLYQQEAQQQKQQKQQEQTIFTKNLLQTATPTSSSANETPSKRVSRKGSTASRSSRSRSSPRIISNRPGASSSDEGMK
jgi:hypothetical protein